MRKYKEYQVRVKASNKTPEALQFYGLNYRTVYETDYEVNARSMVEYYRKLGLDVELCFRPKHPSAPKRE